MDRSLKLINGLEEFEKSIPTFIEAFVEYYGENHRKEIENKFSKARFIGYQTMGDLKSTINSFSQNITKELIEEIINKHDLNLEVKDLTRDNGFEFKNIQPINYLFNLLEENSLGADGRLEDVINSSLESYKRYIPDLTYEDLKEISKTGVIPNTEKFENASDWLKNNILYSVDSNAIERNLVTHFNGVEELLKLIDPDINQDNFKEKLNNPEFQKFIEIKKDYEKAYELYLERMKVVEKYQIELKKYDEIEMDLSKKYMQEFILDNLDLIPDDKRKGLEDYKEDYNKEIYLDSYIRDTLGYSLYSTIDITSFSTKSEENLNDSNENVWISNSIKNDRISYLKKNGIDLGDNYEDYLNSEEARKIWPSSERVDKLIEDRKQLLDRLKKELFDKTAIYQETRRKIDELGLLDKYDHIDMNMYENGGTFVSPNIVQTDTGYELFSLVAVHLDEISDDLDHAIIHELNHLFELHLNEVLGDTYSVICGWDQVDGTIGDAEVTEEDNSKRSYELFNEIINEKIAQEICEIMHKDNVQVFDDKYHLKYQKTTSYEHSSFLVNDFYNEYKDLIIKSRSNGNINIILDAVGKENFDELNSLFETFSESFSGMKIYNLITSLSKKEDNDMTRVYYELCDKRDAILERMRKNYENHKEEELTL